METPLDKTNQSSPSNKQNPDWPNPPSLPSMSDVTMNSPNTPSVLSSSQQNQYPITPQQSIPIYPTHVSLMSSLDASTSLSKSQTLPLPPYANLAPPPQLLNQYHQQHHPAQSFHLQKNPLPQPPSIQTIQQQQQQQQQQQLATSRITSLPRAASYANQLPVQQVHVYNPNLSNQDARLHQSLSASFSTMQHSFPGIVQWQSPTTAIPQQNVVPSHSQQQIITSSPVPNPQISQPIQVVQSASQVPIMQIQNSSTVSSSGDNSSVPQDSFEKVNDSSKVQQQTIKDDSVNNVNEGTTSSIGNNVSHDTLASSTDAGTGPTKQAEFDRSGLSYDSNNRFGYGTYGNVFGGTYYGAPVAVKKIQIPNSSPDVNSDPAVRKIHMKSIQTFIEQVTNRYERVSHACLVRFYGAFLDESDLSAVLVTDLMHGGSLGDSLYEIRKNQMRLQLSSILIIASQICSGIIALHSAGCSWGDAKPENILLSTTVEENGMLKPHTSAKLADFGLSKSVADSLSDHTTLYGTGQPVASYAYKAPETFAGNELDEVAAQAADIYSFGLVLYEMLTMRTPWKRKRFTDVHQIISDGKRPEWPVEGDKDYYGPIPEELRQIVENSWVKEPSSRPSAQDIFRALRAYTDSQTESSVQRPVSDITRNLVPGDSRIAFGQSGTLSKQSSTSTAVAIDGSAELSAAFNGTKESTTIEDEGSDEENEEELKRKRSTVPFLSNPSRLSPLTSPEPRSLNVDVLDGKNLSQQLNDPRRPSGTIQTDRNSGQGKPVSQNIVTGGSDKSQASASTDAMNTDQYDHLSKLRHMRISRITNQNSDTGERNVEEDLRVTPSASGDLQNVPSVEFDKNSAQIGMMLAQEAAQSTLVENAQNQVNVLHGERDNNILTEHVDGRSSMFGATMEGSLPDVSSSTNSSMSVRRKRSKRLQNIIEHAALAFLEIKRREEASGKIPPRQRKEAADKQAAEDSRRKMEKQALEVIHAAQEQSDISTVLEMMKLNRESYHVARAGTLFMEKYCSHDVLYQDVCEEGGVEELYSGVSLYSDKSEICISFCNAITSLSKQFDDKVNHLIRGVGIPSLVMEVLDQHKTSVPVQISGCNSLAAIASTCELSRLAVATLGGPKCVYHAMTKNNNTFRDITLAKSALLAIRCVAERNEDAAKYLIDVSTLDTITRAADVFSKDGIEMDILETYQAFAFYDGGRRTIITSSGLNALSSIMLRNQDPEFLVLCCKFIRSIARWKDRDCEIALLESSISERVTYVMRKSNEIPGEQGARLAWYAAHCCSFLASFGPESKTRLRQVEAIETLIGLLRSRRENARVIRAVTDALGDLINGDQEAKLLAQQCNAITALDEVLRIHDNVPRAKNAIRGTLNFLTLSHTVTTAGVNGRQRPASPDRPPPMPTPDESSVLQQEQPAPQRRRRFNLLRRK